MMGLGSVAVAAEMLQEAQGWSDHYVRDLLSQLGTQQVAAGQDDGNNSGLQVQLTSAANSAKGAVCMSGQH